MNKLIINGNLVKDIELTFTPGTGLAKVRNTVATRRKFKNKVTGQYESDFIPFTAFGPTAEFIANSFAKGQGIQLEAHMQSGSYEKDGKKVYTLEAVVENVEFYGSKKQENNSSGESDFNANMTPVDNSDIPF